MRHYFLLTFFFSGMIFAQGASSSISGNWSGTFSVSGSKNIDSQNKFTIVASAENDGYFKISSFTIDKSGTGVGDSHYKEVELFGDSLLDRTSMTVTNNSVNIAYSGEEGTYFASYFYERSFELLESTQGAVLKVHFSTYTFDKKTKQKGAFLHETLGYFVKVSGNK